jgi:hypothetical protein
MLEGFFRSPRFIEWANGPTKCGRYLLRSSLAAALPTERRVLARRGWVGEKSGHFEEPAGYSGATTMCEGPKRILRNRVFRFPLEFPCQPIDCHARHFRDRFRGVM